MARGDSPEGGKWESEIMEPESMEIHTWGRSRVNSELYGCGPTLGCTQWGMGDHRWPRDSRVRPTVGWGSSTGGTTLVDWKGVWSGERKCLWYSGTNPRLWDGIVRKVTSPRGMGSKVVGGTCGRSGIFQDSRVRRMYCYTETEGAWGGSHLWMGTKEGELQNHDSTSLSLLLLL